MADLSPLDTVWLLLSAFLVSVVLIGSCLLETGLVRGKRRTSVLYRPLMSLAVAGLAFWAIGFGLMHGTSAAGLFGTDRFLTRQADGGAFFLYQLVIAAAVAALVGAALAERARLIASIMIGALAAALLFPLAAHWAWGGRPDGDASGWLAARGFIDFAGASVVHGVGGWLALAALLVIGSRAARADDEERPPRVGDSPMASVGVLVLGLGWFGLVGGSALGFDENVPMILVNTSLAAAAGALALFAGAWVRHGRADISALLNGAIAGLVGVAAGCHLFEAGDAIVTGILTATACHGAARLLERRRVDDVIGVWPAHAVAGLVGTLLVAVLGDSARFPFGHTVTEQFAVQMLGAASIALLAFGGGYLVLRALDQVLPLRAATDDERRESDATGYRTALPTLPDLLGRAQGALVSNFGWSALDDMHERVDERMRLEIETREEAYRQLEEATEFRFIFENAHEGIVQFARDGWIKKANPAAVVLLGFDCEADLVEQAGRWLTRIDWADRAGHRRMLRTLEAHGIARDVEIAFTRGKAGERVDVQLDMRRVPGREGTPTTVLASIIDIGERKSNERLAVERDAATTASHAKSAFLANMSHEIRTPLNGVTGMLELLGRSELDESQRRFVDIAGTSANALLSVINDILDVSKVEAGKLELEHVAFTLPELLADVIDMFAPQAAARDIELAGLVPATIPTRVVGDPERLRQVLINLVGNAIKFTEHGEVTLRAETRRLDAENVVLRIDVSDTGPGIATDECERLFQPFAQADGSSTRRHGGTGLGLTISRQLIELMGGRIGVDSEPGSGTVFHVDLTLPLAGPAGANGGAIDDTRAVSRGRDGVRVLAVDDHPVNLELLHALLVPEGFEVDCVDGAEAALCALDEAAQEGRPFELALLDYQMPERDGEQLARAIRTDERHATLRIVLLTSIDQAIDADERARLRIEASLTKPLRRSRLFDAIDEALGTGTTHVAPPSPAPGAPSPAPAPKRVIKAKPSRRATSSRGAPMAQAGGASHTRPEQRPLLILVVEDNTVNQVVTEELLLAAGHIVTVADNGAEALEQIAAGDVEMVLMDCQMPVMDGFEATRQLRRLEAREGAPRLPVIAVTANAIKGDRERCLEAGMDDYIAKPIDIAQLEAAILRLTPPERSEAPA